MRITFELSRRPLLDPTTNEAEIHLGDVVSIRRVVQPSSEVWAFQCVSVARAQAVHRPHPAAPL